MLERQIIHSTCALHIPVGEGDVWEAQNGPGADSRHRIAGRQHRGRTRSSSHTRRLPNTFSEFSTLASPSIVDLCDDTASDRQGFCRICICPSFLQCSVCESHTKLLRPAPIFPRLPWVRRVLTIHITCSIKGLLNPSLHCVKRQGATIEGDAFSDAGSAAA